MKQETFTCPECGTVHQLPNTSGKTIYDGIVIKTLSGKKVKWRANGKHTCSNCEDL